MHRDRRTRSTAADGASGAGRDGLDGGDGDGGRTESVAGAVTYRVSGTPLRAWADTFHDDQRIPVIDANGNTVAAYIVRIPKSHPAVGAPYTPAAADELGEPTDDPVADTDSDTDVGTDA